VFSDRCAAAYPKSMRDSRQSPMGREVPARHFGLDWLRIGAFSLLMLYHAAMAFVAGDWLVKLAEIEWPSYPMEFLSPWRLATLFIVAGYASRALLARLAGGGAFAWERTKRLILPLLFAMAVIIPPQSWVRLRVGHGYAHDYLHYLTHDAFRFGAVDNVTLPGWEHLWFVFYLWLFTIVTLAALATASPAMRARAAALPAALAEGQRLLWMPLLYFVPVRAAITFTLGESHGLFDDWLSDFIYLPCFLFGFALAAAPLLWPAIGRVWKPALALALASYAVLAAVEALYPGRATPPHLAMALDRAAMAAMMWGMSLVMLRLADTLLNRDHKWRRTLSEAIFPCYIVHQTIIVLVAWWLLPTRIPTAAAFAIILAATAGGCWLFYRIGSALGPLRPLIGLATTPAPMGKRARAILQARPG
jgi:peptidoglycan/LPS O-acetylase OafA/YrhL